MLPAVLRACVSGPESIDAIQPYVGGGTDTFRALNEHYAGHDRVVILTDEQAHYGVPDADIKAPIYTFNLAGYKMGHLPSDGTRFTFGGLTDAAFELIPLLEQHRSGEWIFHPAA